MLFREYNRLNTLLLLKKNNWFFSHHVVMEIFSPEEESIIKDARNLFYSKKKLMITRLKDIASLSGLEKENKAIKHRIIGDKSFWVWRRTI